MFTFEKILETFSGFIAEQDELEIVKTSRGYACIEWALDAKRITGAINCAAPDELLDFLVDYYETVLTNERTMSARDYLTRTERLNIQCEVSKMLDRVHEV